MTLQDFDRAAALDIPTIPIEPEALRKIPRALALDHDILSLQTDGNQLTVAVADADDREMLERIRYATGMHVRALQGSREAIRARLSVLYPQHPIAIHATSENQPPAVAAVDRIHRAAVAAGASDVHIEPNAGGGRVRQRVDGILHQTEELDRDLYAHVVSRIKLLAGMDIADRRQPQDGRYDIELPDGLFDARVSSMPTIDGEKLAIRLLGHHSRIPRLEELDIPLEHVETLQRLCAAPHGFIVAAGPTGSGKTTTLYAALARRNDSSENLCSVEDPIEVRIPGISQTQIHPRAGVTFASALRAFLRQDPNVIMVGEMRDEETATVAASAALSGQLVLTSLHSNNAVGAIDRLAELGVSRRTIAAGLSAVIAQRLVRRLCAHCAHKYIAGAAIAAELSIPADAELYKPVGCAQCSWTGYRGRSVISEILVVDDEIRLAIASGASAIAIDRLARMRGFRPMREHAIARLRAGETSCEELKRVLTVDPAA